MAELDTIQEQPISPPENKITVEKPNDALRNLAAANPRVFLEAVSTTETPLRQQLSALQRCKDMLATMKNPHAISGIIAAGLGILASLPDTPLSGAEAQMFATYAAGAIGGGSLGHEHHVVSRFIKQDEHTGSLKNRLGQAADIAVGAAVGVGVAGGVSMAGGGGTEAAALGLVDDIAVPVAPGLIKGGNELSRHARRVLSTVKGTVPPVETTAS